MIFTKQNGGAEAYSCRPRIEEKFIDELCQAIFKCFDINGYGIEGLMLRAILKQNLDGVLNQYKTGLLEQYKTYCMREQLRRLKSELELGIIIPDKNGYFEIEMDDLLKEIKENYTKIEKKEMEEE